MRYLKKFESEAEKDVWADSDNHVIPNVCLVTGELEFNVAKPLKGVLIQHVDGSLYTQEEWVAKGFSAGNAHGVAVVTDEASFVVMKNFASTQMRWGDKVLVDGVFTAGTESEASTDLGGLSNSAKIREAISGSSAARSCALTYNGKQGYLPSLGELKIMYAHLTEVNAALTIIGGTITNNNWTWSSTQATAEKAWQFNFKSGASYSCTKTDSYQIPCRAFTTL